ncbi:hypothetical protein OIU77_027353 [Salix suchowensis]|uniref:Uncharacterized protein n=1 Tax=Salix suchowensis TaxID=1278906 RepID=A0ABQ9BS38_9ROSI|nr:hypothetical protein OIU77_027353 [Salix suchowensis]
MASAISQRRMEKLGGHLLQFGYLKFHVAFRWWMVEDEGFGAWNGGGDVGPVYPPRISPWNVLLCSGS